MRRSNEVMYSLLHLAEMSLLLMLAVVLYQQIEPEYQFMTFAYNVNKNMYYILGPIIGIAAIKLLQFFIMITGHEEVEYY